MKRSPATDDITGSGFIVNLWSGQGFFLFSVYNITCPFVVLLSSSMTLMLSLSHCVQKSYARGSICINFSSFHHLKSPLISKSLSVWLNIQDWHLFLKFPTIENWNYFWNIFLLSHLLKNGVCECVRPALPAFGRPLSSRGGVSLWWRVGTTQHFLPTLLLGGRFR